jgi:hypothetical protein
MWNALHVIILMSDGEDTINSEANIEEILADYNNKFQKYNGIWNSVNNGSKYSCSFQVIFLCLPFSFFLFPFSVFRFLFSFFRFPFSFFLFPISFFLFPFSFFRFPFSVFSFQFPFPYSLSLFPYPLPKYFTN